MNIGASMVNLRCNPVEDAPIRWWIAPVVAVALIALIWGLALVFG